MFHIFVSQLCVQLRNGGVRKIFLVTRIVCFQKSPKTLVFDVCYILDPNVTDVFPAVTCGLFSSAFVYFSAVSDRCIVHV